MCYIKGIHSHNRNITALSYVVTYIDVYTCEHIAIKGIGYIILLRLYVREEA